jgi:hypothetical protein
MRYSGYVRIDQDFYTEPRWLVKRLLAKETFEGSVLDPACGSGTIPSVCLDHGIKATGSDIVHRGFGTVGDLFDYAEPLENIISNPPYICAEACVRHLLPLARGKVALLLRTAFLESVRRDDFYATMPPRRIWVSKERASMPPGVMEGRRDRWGAVIQPEGRGGTMCYAWFIFEPGYIGPMTINRC